MRRTWKDTLSLGAAGKTVLMDFFREHGYQVEDLTKEIEFSKKNIDFAISAQGSTCHVCVKTDTRLSITRNIVVETLICHRDTSKIIPGWFFTCQAELLAYLDANAGELYVSDWALLKKLITMNEIGERVDFRNNIDRNTLGQIHIIPTEELKRSPAIKLVAQVDVSELQKCKWDKPAVF